MNVDLNNLQILAYVTTFYCGYDSSVFNNEDNELHHWLCSRVVVVVLVEIFCHSCAVRNMILFITETIVRWNV